MPPYSHIITLNATGGFRGGSLSSRSVLQVDGKSFSSLTPVCAETQTYHLTALPWRLFSTQPSVDAHTRMSVFDAVSGFYFGRWPHSCFDQLKRIHFTYYVLSAPLNFQPNWAYRSISCGYPQTCLLCVCVVMHECVHECVCVCLCTIPGEECTQMHKGTSLFPQLEKPFSSRLLISKCVVKVCNVTLNTHASTKQRRIWD